ncbi:MAG: hypothetical protein QNJ45_03615 [Ardenticatenaceae bacterium]|nr:hypothetical protein [Ardenticatenaceae bacterium]
MNNPGRLLLNIIYILVIIAIIFAIYTFIVQQLEEPVPEVPSLVLTPQSEPVQAVIRSDLLQLEENFDIDLNAWELSPPNQAYFERGALVLHDNQFDDEAWARPHLTFDNFVIDVYGRWLGGAIGGSYGVEFRIDDESGDFYSFYLHNDGRYTVGKQFNGSWFEVVEDFSPSIERNGGLNQIRVEAIGDRFRFYINNQFIVDIQNQGLPKGDIRLIASKAEGTEEFMAAFDNLVVARHPGSPVPGE